MTPETIEMTEQQLTEMIQKAIVESSISKELESAKKEIEELKAKRVVTKEEKAEASAKFIRAIGEEKGLAELKTITTAAGSFGYTVPTELADAIHEKKDKIAKIRSRAFVFKLAGNFQLPFEGTAVTSYWITTEADSDLSESNPTTTKHDFTDHYLASRVRIPYKLLNTSAINIENYVTRLASRSAVSTEETAFVGGDGTDRPEGVRTASITGIAQAGANLAYDDFVNLYYGVPEQYRANGNWLMSTAAIKLARKLKDSQNLPIFEVRDETIFGKRLLECTDIPANLGSGGNESEIYFGDLQEYWIKDGEEMIAEKKSVTGRLQFDMFLYEATDGCVVNTDAFRKLTGVK